MFKFLQSLQEAAAPKSKGPVALYLRQIKMYGEDDAEFAKKFKTGQLSKTEVEDMVGEISENDPDGNIPDGFADTVYAAYKAKFSGQVNEAKESAPKGSVASYLRQMKMCCEDDPTTFKTFKTGKLTKADVSELVGMIGENDPAGPQPASFTREVYAAYKAKFGAVKESVEEEESYQNHKAAERIKTQKRETKQTGESIAGSASSIGKPHGDEAKEDYLTTARIVALVDRIGTSKAFAAVQKAYDDDRIGEKLARSLVAKINELKDGRGSTLKLESWDDEDDDRDVQAAMDEAKKRKVKLLSKDEEDKVGKKVDDADKQDEAKGAKKAAVEDEEHSVRLCKSAEEFVETNYKIVDEDDECITIKHDNNKYEVHLHGKTAKVTAEDPDNATHAKTIEAKINAGVGKPLRRPGLTEMARGQVNGSGDPQQFTWAGWKTACKKKHADCEFRGDKDIGGAFVKVNGKGIDIGEWDGESGCVFKDSHDILKTHAAKGGDKKLSESEVYSKAAKVGKSADIKKYIAGKYNVLNQSVGRWTIKEGDSSFRVDPAARPIEVWCEEASPSLKNRARTIQDDINRKLASMGNISESACDDDEDCDVKAAMDEVKKRKINMLPKAVERALDKQVKQADDRSERASVNKVRGAKEEEEGSAPTTTDQTNALYIVDKMSKRSVLGPFNDQAGANAALSKRQDRGNLAVVPGNQVAK